MSAVFNRCWARIILMALTRYGVKHICIAPGSRSTPLTMEAIHLSDQGVICHTHFDERGLGFFALGLNKVEQTPVAIIVTSGTAVANLYPAIIEANQNGHNLIVLSADRPLELINCGANQAIPQANMFAHFPIASVNLPNPAESYSPKWLITQIEQACQRQQQKTGVIHINVPFVEPLYLADEQAISQSTWLQPISSWLAQKTSWIKQETLQQEVLIHANWDHWRTQRGVIIIGQLPASQSMGITHWAETMGWVVLSDVQSGVAAPLPHADIWLANKQVAKQLQQADIVIQFGGHVVSKRVNQFLQQFQGEYWLVSAESHNLNSYHHAVTLFKAKVHHWLRAHPPLRQRTWLLEAIALSQFCETFIAEQVGTQLNEVSFAHYLSRVLPSNGSLFLGNSLFIRLVDALAKLPENYPIYANRGASGIDGLLATTAGIATASKQPLVAVLGDLSTLHDLNSLLLFKQLRQPTIIFVINNQGGAIFDLLPVDMQVKDKFYRMGQDIEFSKVAALFELPYYRPYTWADLTSILKQAYIKKETSIIEIKSAPNEAAQLYQSLLEQIAGANIDG